MQKRRPKIVAIDVVAIGSSTGGPPLLEEILHELPEDFSAAVLIVQHMPKHFTALFPKRMEKILKIRIKEAEHGDIVEAGIVFLAPGDCYMTVKQIKKGNDTKKTIQLQKKSELGPLDTINMLMWSVSQIYREHTVGVILSGMGKDGMLGMRAIKARDGFTIVQKPETSVVDSMPRAVIEDGMADKIMETKELSKYLVKLFE